MTTVSVSVSAAATRRRRSELHALAVTGFNRSHRCNINRSLHSVTDAMHVTLESDMTHI